MIYFNNYLLQNINIIRTQNYIVFPITVTTGSDSQTFLILTFTILEFSLRIRGETDRMSVIDEAYLSTKIASIYSSSAMVAGVMRSIN